MENLDSFVEQLLDGQLKPYLKSEPVPTSNDGPVKVRCLQQSVCEFFKRKVIYLFFFCTNIMSTVSVLSATYTRTKNTFPDGCIDEKLC